MIENSALFLQFPSGEQDLALTMAQRNSRFPSNVGLVDGSSMDLLPDPEFFFSGMDHS